MGMYLYPWQHDLWTNIVRRHRKNGLPHALLVSGPAGIGKHNLSLNIARWLLCQSPAKNDYNEDACGQCHSCQLWAAGSHPDFMLCQPEEGSRQIRIDNVRKVNSMIFQTPQISQCQVVIIKPIDVMNTNAANALLKTLEEPPGESFLLLETERFGSVLPTIRSRCQRISLSIPAYNESLAWFIGTGVAEQDARRALQRNGNAPARAQQWLSSGIGEVQEQWVAQLMGWTKRQAQLGKVADAWLKLEFSDVITWFYHVSCDMMKMASSGDAGCAAEHLTFAEPVTEISGYVAVDKTKLITFQQKLQRILGQILSGAAHHNKSLTIEVLLLEWQELAIVRSGVSS
jgi:DNA polymerase-3 subunit delta'